MRRRLWGGGDWECAAWLKRGARRWLLALAVPGMTGTHSSIHDFASKINLTTHFGWECFAIEMDRAQHILPPFLEGCGRLFFRDFFTDRVCLQAFTTIWQRKIVRTTTVFQAGRTTTRTVRVSPVIHTYVLDENGELHLCTQYIQRTERQREHHSRAH